MELRKSIADKLEIFYKEIEKKKEKAKKMWLQRDLEFRQNEIYEINSNYSVDMFSAVVRG